MSASQFRLRQRKAVELPGEPMTFSEWWDRASTYPQEDSNQKQWARKAWQVAYKQALEDAEQAMTARQSSATDKGEKMSHTPGPWTVGVSGSRFLVIGKDGFTVAATPDNGTPEGMKRTRDGTSQANARLIAAAPDLLEALRKIDDFEDSLSPEGAASIARAAIAKATNDR